MTIERDELRDWHRLFGLLLTDFFTDSPPCCGTVSRPCHPARPKVSHRLRGFLYLLNGWRPSVGLGGMVGRPCHNG